MGAVRMNPNITIIHSPYINILWNEKLCVCNKQIHLDFNFKPFLFAKIQVLY